MPFIIAHNNLSIVGLPVSDSPKVEIEVTVTFSRIVDRSEVDCLNKAANSLFEVVEEAMRNEDESIGITRSNASYCLLPF